ncbi:MAG: FHA domain-containing protein, partial [Anaerolineae bacterium]|nr:FHA domain-containing protein [Anaerolineae bacterium]
IIFVLRVASGLLLLCLLGVILVHLWRDYQRVASQIEAHRRTYGSLVAMREVDGQFLKTGEIHPLLPITSLGRSPTNSVKIDDSFASSEHAVVILRSGQWWLEDRQSRNGTLLNDIPVTQPMVITHGDIIGIGNLKLRLEIEA